MSTTQVNPGVFKNISKVKLKENNHLVERELLTHMKQAIQQREAYNIIHVCKH